MLWAEPNAIMDADVARMMADLGVMRRDQISTPEEGPKRGLVSASAREMAAAKRDIEDRKAKFKANSKGVADSSQAAKINAWNGTPSMPLSLTIY